MNEQAGSNEAPGDQRTAPVVMKFGGTSVENAAAIRRALQLVSKRLRHRPVVVVSALAKVTDQLLAAGKSAAQGHEETALRTVQTLRRRHHTVAEQLVEGDALVRLNAELDADFQVADDLLHSIGKERDFGRRVQDHLLGLGELFSSRMVQAAFLQGGLDAVWVDSKECIVTDAAHCQATPLWEETNQRLASVVGPLLNAGRVPVMGGFVGATRDGIPTTLGRGGSDFTAAIVGAGLHASRVEIWTDVNGVMTTDPGLCANARRVPRMSFDEAAELAYFGAKVLHPATLFPARRANVPVWVLNSRDPECRGTEINAEVVDGGQVKAITFKRGLAVVDVEPLRWLAPELLHEIFETFERHQHNLDLLSASQTSLSLLVSTTDGLAAIADELKGLAHVRWENHKALVCLVGEKVRRRPEVASQAFSAVSDMDLRMVCQGASERSISFLVDEDRAEESVLRLHKLFFSSQEEPKPVQSVDGPPQAFCQAGGSWQ